MTDVPAAPMLLATLDRLLARERRRRRDAALRRTLMAASLAVLLVAGWRIVDRVYGRDPMPVAWALGLVAFVALVGLCVAIRGAVGRSEDEMAREVDRRLALDDRAAAALAIVRGGVASRLAGFVVLDAETTLSGAAGRVDVMFPAKAERRVTAPVRWLARAAAVVVALAILAELLAVGGPIHLLPGVSKDGGADSVVPPAKDAPRREGHGPEHVDGKKPDVPETKKPDEPNPPKPEGDIRVSMKMTKEDFDDKEAVTATVAASATGEIAGRKTFDLRVSVDGVEADTGSLLTVDPGVALGDRTELDLRKVPGLKLEPGEHVARARLTTRTSHEEHASAPVKFRIRAPKDDDQRKGDAPKKPQPKPDPQSRSGDPEKKKDQPNAPAPPVPPPPALDRQVVVPLFGEGETVKKKGLLLVLDPSGGTYTPPSQRPLGDALPDAKRRAEEAVDRAKLSDADRDLVRRYFDLLEDLRR